MKMPKGRTVIYIRNISISVGVLLLLAVGGGVAYTWYVGHSNNGNTTAIAAPAEIKPSSVIKPTKPAPDAKVGASVQSITSPISPGSNASITVRSNADAKCSIKVVYDKTTSTDSGLGPKVADEFGMITWTWTVEESAPLGKWPVRVTCANTKNSAMVQSDLVITK